MKTVLAFLLMTAPAFAQEKIRWTKDFDAAVQEAKKAQKYIVLHFSGPN